MVNKGSLGIYGNPTAAQFCALAVEIASDLRHIAANTEARWIRRDTARDNLALLDSTIATRAK